MYVFTTITDSYRQSAELQLFQSMFEKSFAGDAEIMISNRGPQTASRALKKAISRCLENLEDHDLPEYVLVVREPTVFIGNGSVQEMKNVLDADAGLDCTLPTDFRDHVHGDQPPYLTLRGFDRFADARRGKDYGVVPFDGRRVFMFLLRTAKLLSMDFPEDIFSLPEVLGTRAALVPGACIHPLFDYYCEERKDVLPLVPETVGSLLDIGCSRGGFGKALKAGRSCRVVGIEMNRNEGEKARDVLDEVVIGDVLEVKPGEHFDCVTCLDVLEHFVASERLLERIRNDFLKPEGGYLLLSIPNVGHWSVVEDLLAGRWDYLPVGLLCTTHMRFFTLKTIYDLLENNDFVVERTESIKIPMPDSVRDGMRVLSKHAMEIDESSLETLHYNIVARVR
jgi:SAM-dependent methyltransferase